MPRQPLALEPFDKRPVGKWLLGKNWLAVEENKRFCLLVDKEFFHAIDKFGTYVKIYFDEGGINQSNKFIIVNKPKMERINFRDKKRVTPLEARMHKDREGFRDVNPW